MSASNIKDPVWIGVDLGTQSVRALAMDSAGQVCAQAAVPLTSHRHTRAHWQDPQQWAMATDSVLAAVVRQLDGRTVAAVSACATSGTYLLVDSAGDALSPGVMYDDTNLAQPDVLAEVLETGAALWSALGHRPQLSWPVVKLLDRQRSGNWPAAARVAHQGDYVLSRLAGHRLPTDSSQALKTGVDLRDLHWPAVLESIGLPTQRLPDVVLPGTPIAVVSASAAERTGLAAGTPLHAGTTDGCAAQFAAGAVRPGSWNSVLGTTLVLKGVSSSLLRDDSGAVYSHRAPHGDYWLPGGASSTGAGVLSRYLDADALGRLEPELAKVTHPGVGRPETCYPLLGVGERFPFRAPDATGFLQHDGTELALAAAAEALPPARFGTMAALGIGFLERLCFDLLDLIGADPPDSVTFTGGATVNQALNRLRCSTLGVTVTVPESADTALGAAMLAASDLGDVAVLDARFQRAGSRLEPRTADTARLMPGYRDFVTRLREHGWLPLPLATHALSRSAA